MKTLYRFIAHRATRRLLVAIVVMSQVLVEAHAQQHPIFTQYMFNGLVINPAYTGSHESITATASARRQWTGIQGAPATAVLSAHSPLGFSRSAAGFVAVNDRLGVTNQTMLYATYAYRIPVGPATKLAVGGQAGVTYYRANYNELEVVTPGQQFDPAFAGTDSRFLPNLGIGVYLYNKRYYVGLSLPTLIDNKWNRQDPLITTTQQRHYFLSAGYVFTLNPSLKLKPNVLLKWVEHGPFQYDINANLLIQETLWVGVSYRMQDSVDGLLELNVNKQLSVGYSYGYPINGLAAVKAGTHELVINYRIRQNKNIVFSPRHF